MRPFSVNKAPPHKAKVTRKEAMEMIAKAKDRVRHLLEGLLCPRASVFTYPK